MNALTEIEEFNEVLGTALDNPDVDTIGGFITDHLARVPQKGEILEVDHLRFTILRADARHILMVMVEKLTPPAPDEDVIED